MVGHRFPPLEGDPAPIYLYRPGDWQRETISTVPRDALECRVSMSQLPMLRPVAQGAPPPPPAE